MKLLTIAIAACVLSACAVAPVLPAVEMDDPSPLDRTEAVVEPTETTGGNSDPIAVIDGPTCEPPTNGDECPATTTTLTPPDPCFESNSDECRPTCDVDPTRCVPMPVPTNGD